MRVLHVITGLGVGGAEMQLRALVRHSRHEHAVVGLCNPGPVAPDLRSDGIEVTDLAMRGNRDVTALVRLAALIRRRQFDVVHTHLYRATIYGRAAARLARAPRVVSTEHSIADRMVEGRQASAGIRALYRAAELLGDRTIAVSERVRQSLLRWGLDADRIVVIPNGIDFPAFTYSAVARERIRRELGVRPCTKIVGTVTRLHATKKVDALLRAVVSILDEGHALAVLGEGPERDPLRRLADKLGIADRVLWLGARDASSIMSAYDVYVSPSPSETFGLSTIEALASGLPVVYRSCPAIDELPVSVPRTHRVGEGADDLGAGIRRALDLSETTRACPDEIRRYSISRTAAAVDELYSSLGRRGVSADLAKETADED